MRRLAGFGLAMTFGGMAAVPAVVAAVPTSAAAVAAAVPAATVAASAPFPSAQTIGDPGTASRAAYGRIDRPGAVDFFAVTPARDVSVTIEAVVPVREQSADFRPAVAVLLPNHAGQAGRASVPFPVPAGYGVEVIPPNQANPRRTLFDPNSIERFYRNTPQTVSLRGGRTAYLAVYAPAGRTGDFVLGVASSAHYENASRADLLGQGLALKFGAAPGRALPWWDVGGALLAMLGIAGAGLVALAAFWPRPRARRRAARLRYLTTAGGFASLGAFYAGVRILNRATGMIAVATFQEILAVALLIAAIWLAVQQPDRPPRRYRLFAILWGAGWLVETALLAWYLLVTRIT